VHVTAKRDLLFLFVSLALLSAGVTSQAPDPSAVETSVLYLSGQGPEDAIPWEFFCTAGRNSRKWTTIPVPSCWEQHGFGTYNYGNEINADATPVGNEQGSIGCGSMCRIPGGTGACALCSTDR